MTYSVVTLFFLILFECRLNVTDKIKRFKGRNLHLMLINVQYVALPIVAARR